MKLTSVRVQHFRSIVDSELVPLSDRVTVLVGKNEQGKTTFLRALASLNQKNRYSASDLPNHLRADLEEKPAAKIPIIQAWLSPDMDERNILSQILSDAAQTEEFCVTRFYDGHYSYKSKNKDGAENDVKFTPPDISQHVGSIKKSVDTLQEKLGAHATRLTAFTPSLSQATVLLQQFIAGNFSDALTIGNLVSTFTTALKALPGQDEPIQTDIVAATKEIELAQARIQKALENDPRAKFHELIPRFVLHSTSIDRIPNEVNVAAFVKDPEGTSKGMANLCKVAGLSSQKIQELSSATDTPIRETYEDHYRAGISGGINEFWTQERYNIHFRIEKDRLSVSISDDTYSRRISPSERSDGFQWYLSFYSALLSEVSATVPTVVLLDNPGLELHADGQRDIKRFLEEKLPGTTQVIYVTHSPAMIDTFNLEQVRRVELRPEMRGTKVLKLAIGGGTALDLLEPVRSAIGASLVNTLVSNDFNVVVEGAADRPILEAAFAIFHPDQHRKIVINGSVSETGSLMPMFYQRSGLPFVVYLDADSTGRDIRTTLTNAGIPAEKIVYLGDVFQKGDDFELEDILDAGVYHTAVQRTYPEKSGDPPGAEAGKLTKKYERAFKAAHNIGFNKHRVAGNLKQILIEHGSDQAGINDLRTLAQRLWEVLQGQMKAGPQAVQVHHE
jgi:energy-coupling factor transporter ATP-binding protein EcfA2